MIGKLAKKKRRKVEKIKGLTEPRNVNDETTLKDSAKARIVNTNRLILII